MLAPALSNVYFADSQRGDRRLPEWRLHWAMRRFYRIFHAEQGCLPFVPVSPSNLSKTVCVGELGQKYHIHP